MAWWNTGKKIVKGVGDYLAGPHPSGRAAASSMDEAAESGGKAAKKSKKQKLKAQKDAKAKKDKKKDKKKKKKQKTNFVKGERKIPKKEGGYLSTTKPGKKGSKITPEDIEKFENSKHWPFNPRGKNAWDSDKAAKKYMKKHRNADGSPMTMHTAKVQMFREAMGKKWGPGTWAEGKWAGYRRYYGPTAGRYLGNVKKK